MTDGAVRLPTVMTFVVAMFAATMALVAFGYVATREWRSGTNLLLERRANEALALVRAALSADMKGAWITAIVPFNTTVLDEEPPYGLFQVAARAFARFPYPESFVLWKRDRTGRRHRPTPSTAPTGRRRGTRRPSSDDPFPVVLVRDPAELAGLVAAVREQATAASPFLVLERSIEGTPVPGGRARALRVQPAARTAGIHGLHGQRAVAARAVFRSAGGTGREDRREPGRPLDCGVRRRGPDRDEGGAGRARRRGDLHTRFPLLFIDPALVKSIASRPTPVREWTVHVRSLPDRALLATLQGARRMFFLITVAASASLLALVLTVRADRASVALASMKSDFVAAVTHELKTPVALIRLVGDTLANGRYTSPKTVQEYAGLLSVEASRLGSSIDNLLTYARYSGARAADSTELVDVEAGRPGGGCAAGVPADSRDTRIRADRRRCRPTSRRCASTVRPSSRRSRTSSTTRSSTPAPTRRLAVSGRAAGRSLTLTVKDSGSGSAARTRPASSSASIAAATCPPAAAASGCRSPSASSRATAAGSTCGARWAPEPKST